MSRDPQVTRWQHFRASLSRQARGRGKDSVAIVILAIAGITMMLWIFTQQKAALPSWAPFVGEEFAELTADFNNAHAVTPGQGQAVIIAGITVGKISSVDLEDGRAVVGLSVKPEYLDVIHEDATLLLRPKTSLNDMTLEIDPGANGPTVEDGHNFPLSQTNPSIKFESFIAALDADTRQYIQLLVAGGAEGIGGRGKQLSNVFRRFQPFSHAIADLNRAVAERRRELARVIHNFGLLTTELGRRDRELERFVTSSKDVLGNFANQHDSIEELLVELPSTLATLESAMRSSDRFATVAAPALTGLIPQSEALGPAFKANQRLFEQTTVPIRDQIRPFTRQIRPTLNSAAEAAKPFERATRNFGEALGNFTLFLNRLAFKPKGSRESYLFYLPWVNHNLNANFNLTDAGGPILRGPIIVSCNASRLAYQVAPRKPYIQTILQGARIPTPRELPTIAPDPEGLKKGLFGCGPDSP